MTPLAHRILANQLKPAKDRMPLDDDAMHLHDITSVVCFDVTSIRQFIEWQAAKMMAVNAPWPTAFLPANRTWIEFADSGGIRTAILLEAIDDRLDQFRVVWVAAHEQRMMARTIGHYEPALGLPQLTRTADTLGTMAQKTKTRHAIMLLLAAINAPKVFARVEHDPHTGLARKLAASKAMPGKYPLHAWHEIKLEGWMHKVEHGTRRAKGATGEKAQHFVRAHPRFQNGKWVIVKWHRRGNPELGMRRARYSVQMPNSTA